MIFSFPFQPFFLELLRVESVKVSIRVFLIRYGQK